MPPNTRTCTPAMDHSPAHLVLGCLGEQIVPLLGQFGVENVGVAILELLALRLELAVLVRPQRRLLLLERGLAVE